MSTGFFVPNEGTGTMAQARQGARVGRGTQTADPRIQRQPANPGPGTSRFSRRCRPWRSPGELASMSSLSVSTMTPPVATGPSIWCRSRPRTLSS